MDSLKFSFFDLATFLLPGGFLLSVVIWLFEKCILFQSIFSDIDGLYFLIPFIFISYFIGHVLSYLGKIFESISTRKSLWKENLEKTPKMADKLNIMNLKLFNESFYVEEEPDKVIGVAEGAKFFDNAYNYLYLNDKKEIFPVLQAQHGFFRTASVVWLSLFLFFTTFYLTSPNCNDISNKAILIMASISLLLIPISILLSNQRRKLMCSTVYSLFLNTNTNL